MSSMVLIDSRADSIRIPVSQDPWNANALTGELTMLHSGDYKVEWRALSTDGHAVKGVIAFTVVGHMTGSMSPTAPMQSGGAGSMNHTLAGSPSPSIAARLAMLARGIGMAALLAFAGLTFFAVRGEPESERNYWRPAGLVGALASAALIIHFLLWVAQASAVGFTEGWLEKALQTAVGRREGMRTAFTILALCGSWLARRSMIALIMASAALAMSAFVGHAAAINPAVSITSKIAHLAAGAVWLGGLLWLLIQDREQVESYAREARKVSAAAGLSALFVLVSGVIQTGVILSWEVSALTSAYAIIAGMKLLGFFVLLGFGAYNRFRILPWLDFRVGGRNLQRTVLREISVMALVAVLGGVLAYVSPP